MSITRLDDHRDQAGAWDVLEAASGDLAFDVGSNIGQAAKVLAKGFKRVVAFEPCLESYDILAAEAPPNVTAVALAVSSCDGHVTLEEHANSVHTGQLTSGDGLHWGPKVGSRRLPCRTLDSLALDFGVPDFVKVDVEGHELEVVRGGLETLAQVSGLIIEVHRQENERVIRRLLPGRRWKKLEHDMRPGSRIRANHYWLWSQI